MGLEEIQNQVGYVTNLTHGYQSHLRDVRVVFFLTSPSHHLQLCSCRVSDGEVDVVIFIFYFLFYR